MSRIYAVPTQDFLQKTLSAQLLTGTTASASFSDVTGIPNLPGVFIVDRVDANGVETPSKREVISFTSTSGSTVVTLGRGLAGSTAQDHQVGAIVEFSPDIVWAQSLYDGLSQVVVPSTGLVDTTKIADLSTIQTLANKNLSIPTITLGSDATGDLYYRGAGATLLRLPIGTSGQILSANASLPVWAAASGNTDGWTSDPNTWVYVSALTFKISGVDVTAIFTKGTKIKFTQTTVKYAYVVSSTFSTDTTVTIALNDDYTLANAAISAPAYSYQSNPQAFPLWFNFTFAYGGFSANPTPTVLRYSVEGRNCHAKLTASGNGTSNATTLTTTVPFVAAQSDGIANAGRGVDNGSIQTGPAIAATTAASATINWTKFDSSGWTNTGTKSINFDFWYEI